MVEQCYTIKGFIKKLRPSTLEGCVVRISDMIAYIGKDRQDAYKTKIEGCCEKYSLGSNNSEIISTIIEDIINNSLDKPYLSLSGNIFNGITEMLEDNNNVIYQSEEVTKPYFQIIKPMMKIMYKRFLEELKGHNHNSLIYQHYLNGSVIGNYYRHVERRYIQLDIHNSNDIVADFMASMTDDYFIDAFRYLYPKHELANSIQYVEYFDKRYTK